jgi:hypothetical protein
VNQADIWGYKIVTLPLPLRKSKMSLWHF